MARIGSGGGDVISRCLRSRTRDREDLENSGEIIRGGGGMGPGESAGILKDAISKSYDFGHSIMKRYPDVMPRKS